METLEQFHQTQRVIEDFVARTLSELPGDFARLVYTASLRDTARDCYCHERLEAVYPVGAVQQALAHCHAELFLKFLEKPLEQQAEELGSCLVSMAGDFPELVRRWQGSAVYRALLTPAVPGYLHDLFCSNLRALLGLLAEENASAQRVA